MTKDILLKISGLQMEVDASSEDETPEPVELIASATYYEKNDKHYIMYEEVEHDTFEVTKNLIKIEAGKIEITKKGSSNVHMVFEHNKKNMTYYCTPYGSLTMGIAAHEIEVTKKEDEICVELAYALDFNYEHIADCTLSIFAQSRKNEENG